MASLTSACGEILSQSGLADCIGMAGTSGRRSLRILAATVFVLIAAALPAPAAMKAHAVAKMTLLDGKSAGTVDFAQTNHGVLITFDMAGLPSGAHGIHIHTSGNCDRAKGFYTAGPHLSFEPKAHGFLAKGGPHAGDLPNQWAASDGTLRASTLSNLFSLGNGKKSIFDRDGASIIVDARPDDYASQPDGKTGARIACGVIVRTVGPSARKGASHLKHG